MRNPLLFLNYRLITPLLGLLGPHIAYRLNYLSGIIGKGPDRPSLRFEGQTVAGAAPTMTEVLGINRQSAEDAVRTFLRLESRVLMEHLWLKKGKTKYLDRMIDMNAMRPVAERLKEKGPMLLLSAHTSYYFVIPWALHELGAKVAYVMADPSTDSSPANRLKESGTASFQSLAGLIPVVLTDKGNTVKKCIDLLKEGYSVIIVLDAPGYSGRGIRLQFFDRPIWVSSGCRWIHEGARVPVAAIISRLAKLHRPYEISFSDISPSDGRLDLQMWSDELQRVVRRSPESWLGWFYFRDMV